MMTRVSVHPGDGVATDLDILLYYLLVLAVPFSSRAISQNGLIKQMQSLEDFGSLWLR